MGNARSLPSQLPCRGAGGSIDMLAILYARLFLQDISKMLEQTSRVSLHITTKKRVHMNKCLQITGFKLNCKITFNNKHLNYVVFCDLETSMMSWAVAPQKKKV
jgi:hypothetical protein